MSRTSRLIAFWLGGYARPVTDRLWQLRQHLRGNTDACVWYAGEAPPTPGRPWWRLHG